jgi:hypothetical protein
MNLDGCGCLLCSLGGCSTLRAERGMNCFLFVWVWIATDGAATDTPQLPTHAHPPTCSACTWRCRCALP